MKNELDRKVDLIQELVCENNRLKQTLCFEGLKVLHKKRLYLENMIRRNDVQYESKLCRLKEKTVYMDREPCRSQAY